MPDALVAAVKNEATIFGVGRLRTWRKFSTAQFLHSSEGSTGPAFTRSASVCARPGPGKPRHPVDAIHDAIRKQCNEEEQVIMTGKVSEVGKTARSGRFPHSESSNQQRLWQSNRQTWAMREQVTHNTRMGVYGEIGRGLALEDTKTYGEGRSTAWNGTVWCVVYLLAPPV